MNKRTPKLGSMQGTSKMTRRQKNNDKQQHVQRTKHRTRGQYYEITRGQDNKISKRPRKQFAMRTRAKVESKMIAPKTSPMQGMSA